MAPMALCPYGPMAPMALWPPWPKKMRNKKPKTT